jgi:S-adenosylmethionine:tRNA ribosyltransferase-isomerase
MTLKTSDFDYDLPGERIAQTPLTPRDSSRLLVLQRNTRSIEHRHFREVGEFLRPGDLLVVNQTRVIPARIFGKKAETGGKVEILLLKRIEAQIWEALVGGKRMHVGKRIILPDRNQAQVIEELGGAKKMLHFDAPVSAKLNEIGQMPLPPYIHETLDDPERYQTVFAHEAGSAAAPTAGLHFTPELLTSIQKQGVGLAKATLHVGLDTFAPVHEEEIIDHEIHTEWCQLDASTAALINKTKAEGGRVIAVGTTSVRTLESAAQGASEGKAVASFEGATDLYITPGYGFKIVDAMITNFHLPRSTLLMLVSAFAGRKEILNAYQVAIENEYRFYSFGDAMLIL